MYEEDLAKVYDELYAHGVRKDYAAEAADLIGLIRSRNPAAASLLDVACGTGEHLLHLRRGFRSVAGLELAEPMRRIASGKLPGVPIHAGDMRSFQLGTRFDAVTCLFSSIGYVRDFDELRQAIERMAAHLNPGGVLVCEPWFAPDQWRDGHVSHTVAIAGARTIVRMSYSSRTGRSSRMRMSYLVGDTGVGLRHFEDEHVMTLFTTEEYEQAFAAAGLTNVDRIAGWAEGRDRIVANRPGS